VGAILGLPKNENLRYLGDKEALFGLEIRNPLRMGYFSLNLVDTKNNPTFRPLAKNPHTQMRYEFIRAPRYRISFSHRDLGPKLASLIARRETVYTPCLGLAWMIAWVGDGVRVERAEEETGVAQGSYVSLVRSDDVDSDISWDDDGVYQRIRMPAEMQPDREVTRYQEYIIETTGRSIRTKLKRHWRFGSGACFSAM